MELSTLWFILIAVLWIGYFVLEGFDFGVGMLLPFLSKGEDEADTERRKRVLLTTIGPHWDGNEVWLLTAGGATFAAFPHWYATLFSGFYLALLLILVALIIRNLGFEYRGKGSTDTWRRNWDLGITIGSFVPAFLWGVAFANIVNGTPIDENMEYTGNLFTLLNPLGIIGGLTTLTLFLTHGAIFVSLKTDGQIRHDARALATKTGIATAVLAVIFLSWTNLNTGNAASWALTVIAALALVAALACNFKGREGWAFIGTTVTTLTAVASLFVALFPDVMPSTLNPEWSITAAKAASSHYTLVIMTGAAVLFVPIVLAYQAWTYWVFRKRITTAHIPEHAATY
ncbi:cytochrome d ubiquinol oxidase subunit II [Dermatophilus congolensis]|uniref:Cytochrome d ubiquinol oxidase subunit 2 n=1 Tax=Dermatophilus congolensis TaxID=1863 RepID=A0A239V5J0_9MICO|nr:cytochrome d ubiquinol oxidase subunit II [Dermatophilus congolensis]MBO3130214.1 cytochrome d ubiquinol oxidase subunit II [Dermatophilus congolensis]MBO3131157.1 cytochrome d ubiquinol oxidase subunit II [Dermatophilus congolensis]MBO3134684.1 cytochrome d ubiquinol oxidase subunit II [Dermatophilus congolensis]MBO3136920.1 cytochrome d ubiquinol oxidase subunit II [Dermatophilus congolensis]MBO3139167.1 cytochrome d ubiquinol oxidase subunit II [Dermatophilus congolensis]